jgi:hypothetical protein
MRSAVAQASSLRARSASSLARLGLHGAGIVDTALPARFSATRGSAPPTRRPSALFYAEQPHAAIVMGWTGRRWPGEC